MSELRFGRSKAEVLHLPSSEKDNDFLRPITILGLVPGSSFRCRNLNPTELREWFKSLYNIKLEEEEGKLALISFEKLAEIVKFWNTRLVLMPSLNKNENSANKVALENIVESLFGIIPDQSPEVIMIPDNQVIKNLLRHSSIQLPLRIVCHSGNVIYFKNKKDPNCQSTKAEFFRFLLMGLHLFVSGALPIYETEKGNNVPVFNKGLQHMQSLLWSTTESLLDTTDPNSQAMERELMDVVNRLWQEEMATCARFVDDAIDLVVRPTPMSVPSNKNRRDACPEYQNIPIVDATGTGTAIANEPMETLKTKLQIGQKQLAVGGIGSYEAPNGAIQLLKEALTVCDSAAVVGFTDVPELRLKVLNTLGQVYNHCGRSKNDLAVDCFSKALTQQLECYLPVTPDYALPQNFSLGGEVGSDVPSETSSAPTHVTTGAEYDEKLNGSVKWMEANLSSFSQKEIDIGRSLLWCARALRKGSHYAAAKDLFTLAEWIFKQFPDRSDLEEAQFECKAGFARISYGLATTNEEYCVAYDNQKQVRDYLVNKYRNARYEFSDENMTTTGTTISDNSVFGVSDHDKVAGAQYELGKILMMLDATGAKAEALLCFEDALRIYKITHGAVNSHLVSIVLYVIEIYTGARMASLNKYGEMFIRASQLCIHYQKDVEKAENHFFEKNGKNSAWYELSNF